MSKPLGPKSLALLHHLARHGDKNRLEIERELGMAQLAKHISDLRLSSYIQSLPKKRRELVRYAITDTGRMTIGAHMQRQESLRYRPVQELPLYVPKETPVRSGSMYAYTLPSRGMR